MNEKLSLIIVYETVIFRKMNVNYLSFEIKIVFTADSLSIAMNSSSLNCLCFILQTLPYLITYLPHLSRNLINSTNKMM